MSKTNSFLINNSSLEVMFIASYTGLSFLVNSSSLILSKSFKSRSPNLGPKLGDLDLNDLESI